MSCCSVLCGSQGLGKANLLLHPRLSSDFLSHELFGFGKHLLVPGSYPFIDLFLSCFLPCSLCVFFLACPILRSLRRVILRLCFPCSARTFHSAQIPCHWQVQSAPFCTYLFVSSLSLIRNSSAPPTGLGPSLQYNSLALSCPDVMFLPAISRLL